MTKHELISVLSERAGTTKNLAESMIDHFTAIVINEVAKGSYVKIVGFGTFMRSRHKAVNKWNPITCKKMRAPSRNRPRFKAHQSFVDRVGKP